MTKTPEAEGQVISMTGDPASAGWHTQHRDNRNIESRNWTELLLQAEGQIAEAGPGVGVQVIIG